MLTDREYNVFHRKVTQRLSARGYEKSTAFYMSPQHSRDDPFGQSTVFGANGELQGTRRGVAFRSAKPVPFDMMADAILNFGVLPDLTSGLPTFHPFDPDTFQVPAKPAATTTLAPHQQRVVEEKQQLDERLSKLTAFLESPACNVVDANEVFRLNQQHLHMERYSTVLGERIAAFGEAA